MDRTGRILSALIAAMLFYFLCRGLANAAEEALIPVMTANTHPDGFAVMTSGDWVEANVFKVFDGSDSTYISVPTKIPLGIIVRLPAPVVAYRFYLKAGGGLIGTGGVLLGSNDDGASWIEIARLDAEDMAFNNSTAYSSYRLQFPVQTKTNQFRTWQLYGEPPAADPPPEEPPDEPPEDPPDEPGIEFPEGFPEQLAEVLTQINMEIRESLDDLQASHDELNEKTEKASWLAKLDSLCLTFLCGVTLMAFVWDFIRRGPV